MKKKIKRNAQYFHDLVAKEAKRAVRMHGNFNSLHEGYGVLMEEVREFEEEVFKKSHKRDHPNLLTELVQIGAVVQKIAEGYGLTKEQDSSE